MIIDSLENAAKYTGIHPLFAKAFEYIASVDLVNIEIGKYEIITSYSSRVENCKDIYL